MSKNIQLSIETEGSKQDLSELKTEIPLCQKAFKNCDQVRVSNFVIFTVLIPLCVVVIRLYLENESLKSKNLDDRVGQLESLINTNLVSIDRLVGLIPATRIIGSIDGSQITDNSISATKIRSVSIESIPDIPTTKVVGLIDGSKLIDFSVVDTKVSSVSGSKIISNTITSDKIVSLDGGKLIDNTIISNKILNISLNSIPDISIKVSRISGNVIIDNSLSKEKIQEVYSDRIVGNISSSVVTYESGSIKAYIDINKSLKRWNAITFPTTVNVNPGLQIFRLPMEFSVLPTNNAGDTELKHIGFVVDGTYYLQLKSKEITSNIFIQVDGYLFRDSSNDFTKSLDVCCRIIDDISCSCMIQTTVNTTVSVFSNDTISSVVWLNMFYLGQ